MKKMCFAVLLLCATAGFAMPIASSARAMVPSELQQLIGVDYRALKDSPTAQALKDKVMPQNLKDLETALKGIGISSDRDLGEEGHSNHRRGAGVVLRQGRPQEDEAQEDLRRQIRHGHHLSDG